MLSGWQKKADKLRMVILSAAHQLAQELPPDVVQVLAMFRRVAATHDGTTLADDIDRIEPHGGGGSLLWEPAETHGWKIQATMYLQNGELWWLVHAVRRDEKPPRDNEVSFVNRFLKRLGAAPADAVIGPQSGPVDEPALPFGWWTWRNVAPLYEVQVHEHAAKKGNDAIRIVRLGTPESNGYMRIDMTKENRR